VFFGIVLKAMSRLALQRWLVKKRYSRYIVYGLEHFLVIYILLQSFVVLSFVYRSKKKEDMMNQYSPRSNAQLEILSMLENGMLTPKELATSLGKNCSTTRTLLRRLVRDGLVCKFGEHYRLTPRGAGLKAAGGNGGKEEEEYICRIHGGIGVNIIRTEWKGVVHHLCWFCMAEFLASHGCADVTPKRTC